MTSVEVAGVLAPDLYQAALPLHQIHRQQSYPGVIGAQHSPTSHRAPPPDLLSVWDARLDPISKQREPHNAQATHCSHLRFMIPKSAKSRRNTSAGRLRCRAAGSLAGVVLHSAPPLVVAIPAEAVTDLSHALT